MTAIIAWDHDADQDPTAIDPALDFRVIAYQRADVEIAGTLELADEVAAGGGVILVVDHGGNAVHIQAEREAEKQQHQHGHGQRHGEAARIAGDVVQFLDTDGA